MTETSRIAEGASSGPDILERQRPPFVLRELREHGWGSRDLTVEDIMGCINHLLGELDRMRAMNETPLWAEKRWKAAQAENEKLRGALVEIRDNCAFYSTAKAVAQEALRE